MVKLISTWGAFLSSRIILVDVFYYSMIFYEVQLLADNNLAVKFLLLFLFDWSHMRRRPRLQY